MRRLILSRKGFDGTAGGGDSPLLPDGRLLSLPIPESPDVRPDATVTYADLRLDGVDCLTLLSSLHPRRSFDGAVAHLDPDLAAGTRSGRDRRAFRGLFGQGGAAATHLTRQAVGPGDLFLFFGRFRATELAADGRLRFARGARPFHAFFGYLEVGERLSVPAEELTSDRRQAWAPDFPHFLPTYRPHRAGDVIFVGAERLSFAPTLPGFGLFRDREALRLTRADARLLSEWRLPAVFDGVALSYNRDPLRRRRRGEHLELLAAARGQEFVCEATPEIAAWAESLVVQSDLWEP